MSTSFFDDDDDDVEEAPVFHAQVATIDRPASPARQPLYNRSPSLPPLDDDLDLRHSRDSYSVASPVGRTDDDHSSITHRAARNGSSSSRYIDTSSSRGRMTSPSLQDILDDVNADDGSEMGNRGDKETRMIKMIRCWRNENAAPELLKFPRRLVERFLKDLVNRKALVKQVQASTQGDDALYLQASIAATENMRASHVLKAYTRQRLFKIEQNAEYYLTLPDRDTRLYRNEIEHAQGYVALKKAYLENSALNSLPERIRAHDIPVLEPDFSSAVFCRVRRDCGPVVLPDGSLMSFEKESQHLLRYSTIRDLLAKDLVELI